MAKLAARWRRQWRWFILHTYFVEWVNMYQVFFETMRIRKLHWKILVANSESLKLILNARFIDEHTMYRYRLQIRFNHCAKTAMYDKIWWVQKLFIKKYARYEPIWAIISADGGRLSQYKLCLHVHTHTHRKWRRTHSYRRIAQQYTTFKYHIYLYWSLKNK